MEYKKKFILCLLLGIWATTNALIIIIDFLITSTIAWYYILLCFIWLLVSIQVLFIAKNIFKKMKEERG